MIVSNTAVQKSTTVAVLALILIVLGIYSYTVLPRESEPDITIPYVFVATDYRGVSSTDIETAITVEIEKKIKGLEGLKKMRSISSQGSSLINLEFVTGTDIDRAVQDVKDKVDEAKNSLPGDLEDDPIVFEVNLSEMPIAVYSFSGTCGLPCLKELADDLKDEIEGVAGVLEVNVTGGLEREIRIEISPDKLTYYGLNINTIRHRVRNENTNTSGGNIRLGMGRFQLQVPGEFKTPEEIYGLILATHNGEPVYLKDVARVIDGFKEETSISRLDGQEAINISVKKRSGENIINISEAVDKIVEKNKIFWPSGTEITKIIDKARDIKVMVTDLENNILTGLMLILIVIFFVMGIRNAILVSMAIPFSMLLSFTILHLMGITLNMVVLFSLTLSLGMLVDNAIVIIENCYRFMEQGTPRVEAVMKATAEVSYPVIGSTVTTIAAFTPMLFWPGIMGEFMGYLPLTLIITLSSSLFVAMVINPAMASLFMKVKKRSAKRLATPISDTEQPTEIKGFFLESYGKILNGALAKPFSVTGLGICVLILMIQGWLLVVGLEKPIEFFPELDPRGIYVNIDVPEGADLNYIDRIIQRIERALVGIKPKDHDPTDRKQTTTLQTVAHKQRGSQSDLKNIQNIYTKGVISTGGGSSFAANTPNHIGIRFLELEERWRSSHDTVREIRHRIEGIPGGEITIAKEAEGPPTGAPINIEITGKNFRILGEISRKIRAILSQLPHVKDIHDDFVEGIPSVQVLIDRQKAAMLGLTTDSIGFALKSAYNGLEISSFREANKDYDITLQLAESDRKMVDLLHELILPTPSGQMVPLSTVAKIVFTGSIGDINRTNNERVITVSANVDAIKTTGPVARTETAKLLQEFPLPPGYKITFTGEFEAQQESQDFLGKAFMIALILIFLILVTMFNSVGQPFIIMTSVILSLGGVFLGLAMFSLPFGIIMSGVGVISLAGIVVNNAIVLIDYINRLRRQGFALKDAVIAAGATRLRPVLLTATTTILGLIPMITGISFEFRRATISWASESSQWWQSMAVVIVFGLIMATFLTLIVVPTLYYLFENFPTTRGKISRTIRTIYWKPYPRLAGISSPMDHK